jgi:hypothetical protein
MAEKSSAGGSETPKFKPDKTVVRALALGGLLGGSALAFLARRVPNLLDMEGFEDAQDDPVQPMVEKALEHMGKLEFIEAGRCWSKPKHCSLKIR